MGGYCAVLHTLPQVYGGVWVGEHRLSCIAEGVNCSSYYVWLTNFVQNREGNCTTFWGAVVANFATTTADGELEQGSNLHILQKCSSGHLISYANKKGHSIEWPYIHDGGDEGDRTPDLLTASQALSQLSYAPVRRSTIRELGRRCKDNFGKYFAGGGEGTQPGRGRGNGPRSPAMPLPARGARPGGGGHAAPSPTPLGHLESRGTPIFASAARAAIRPTAILPAPGPLSGANRAPYGPAIPKTMPVYGAGPGNPGHAAIGKIKTAGRRLAHSAKCRVWTACPGPAP